MLICPKWSGNGEFIADKYEEQLVSLIYNRKSILIDLHDFSVFDK